MAEPADSYPKHLDWLRYLSAWLLFTYGASKLIGRQFSLPAEMALRPVGSLSGHDLAWFYYNHSHVYAIILGLIQLAGGALLLFRKTALAGSAITLPVMANILMINVFFAIAWGALCTSAFIFTSMLAILWHEREALVGVFWTGQAGEPAGERRFHRAIAAAVVLMALSILGVGSWLSSAARISK